MLSSSIISTEDTAHKEEMRHVYKIVFTVGECILLRMYQISKYRQHLMMALN
jgi:hypothetical protein